jgi:hypothetical protein
MQLYNKKRPHGLDFAERLREHSLASARAVVPLVLDLMSVRSVCDVGCGIAPWLRVFREFGIDDILGLDGDYVDRELLHIPADRFIASDLTKPIKLDRRFDLAISLEVAEHLPQNRAAGFVRDLTALAPVVLFSAAIPGQGGAHHVNEQWQSYWAHLFGVEGYLPADVIRPSIWDDDTILWWYRQNIMIYCAENMLVVYPKLACAISRKGVVRSYIHPHLYYQYSQPPGFRWLATALRIWSFIGEARSYNYSISRQPDPVSAKLGQAPRL